MKMSLLRERYSVAIIAFVFLSSLIGKPVLATPGDTTFTSARGHALVSSGGEMAASPATSSTTPSSIAVSAFAAGVLTCANPSTTLTATTTATGGTTFIWSGPNFFSALGSSVTATTAGLYTVTATNAAGTGTATVTVIANTAAPAGVTASNNGPLTCTITSAILTGSTSTTGATLAWKGTGTVANFTAAGGSATVTAPGVYILTATNPSTGCTSTAQTAVIETLTVPTGVTASHLGELTCSNNTVYLNGSSTSLPVTYAWSGPNGFTASGAATTASVAGTYTFTATYTPTGCTASATAVVSRIFTAPGNVTATTSGALNCTSSSVTLTASSSTSGANYNWTGPNGFTASGTTVTTSTPGTYTMTADDGSTAFGCTASTTVTVVQDLSAPASVTATTSGLLNCANTSVTLTGASSSGASFSWTGPSGFTASGATATTSTPGTYTVTAIDPTSGCSATASATVTQNITSPALTITSATGTTTISCTNPTLSFTGGSTAQSMSYAWSGPNNYSANTATASMNAPGTYTLTGTSGSNGCSNTSSVVIGIDTALPTAISTSSVPENAVLTCTSPNVVLTESSATSGATYSWTGPGGFTATGASVSVNTVGTYQVTITNPGNGCSTPGTTTTVTQNVSIPIAVSTTTSNKLSCFTTSVSVTANSSTTGATYAWTGPGGFSANTRVATATLGGTYTVTVTNPANGCTTSKTATVAVDTATPVGVTATNSGPLTCSMTTVTLTGNSTTPGVTYIWNGPNGFSDAEQVSTSAFDSGAYVLTVTSLSNGCSTNDTTIVAADFAACSAVARKLTAGNASPFNDAANGGGFTCKIYPNPTRNAAVSIEFSTAQAAQVIVGVYNNAGVLERVLFSNSVEANQSYRLTLNPGGLTPGVHYCQIRVDGKVYSSKLLLLP